MNRKRSEYRFDELLVDRFRKGEKEALTLLIKKFHPKLVRIIRYHIHDCDPVEDIAQECWYSIIRKLPDIKLKISFHAWAASVARRKAIDWIREQQRRRIQTRALHATYLSKIESSEADIEETLMAGLPIRIGLQHLPPTQRIVLEMFYLENLSLQEISKVLNIPEGTVKSRLFHARENLKSMIIKQTEH